LKQRILNEYYQVSLYPNKNAKHFNKTIHRLLAYVFIKKTNNNFDVVNHIDENKLNNSLDNLEWMTGQQNTEYSCGVKVQQIDIKTNKVIRTYNTIKQASIKLGIKNNGSAICSVCNGRGKTAYGYKWKKVE